MCRYRYYYFAGCRHQQTVLIDYCADAQPIQGKEKTPWTVHSHAPAPMTAGEVEGAREGGKGGAERILEEGMAEERSNGDDLPSLCSSIFTHSPGSSFDTGSASITAEPDIHYSSPSSSLHQAEHPSSSHSSDPARRPSSSRDMDGLPLWSGGFRHWMTGSTGTAPRSNIVDSRGHVSLSNKNTGEAVSVNSCATEATMAADTDDYIQPLHDVFGTDSPVPSARHRQAGIQERTDESCDLAKRYENRSQDVPDGEADHVSQQRHPAAPLRVLPQPQYSSCWHGRPPRGLI